ncbi:hypothetical protein Tdes44962_MAKER02574 [Teratosphaeria destructans]|uniref:Uncharacterized protein n=1 Tax=Teratosphaeria destructans TaxID=418781 RepID=A0A9W7STB4_9PEZI|nr:hypothetical protein Tdes44962_MAKER02574 [Teratosphaeria destructans]
MKKKTKKKKKKKRKEKKKRRRRRRRAPSVVTSLRSPSHAIDASGRRYGITSWPMTVLINHGGAKR